MDHYPHTYWDVYWHLCGWVASGELPVKQSSVGMLVDKMFPWHDTQSLPELNEDVRWLFGPYGLALFKAKMIKMGV